MLDALLETIGILGTLALLALKLGKPCADAIARKTGDPDQAHEMAEATPSARDACRHRRMRRGKRHPDRGAG